MNNIRYYLSAATKITSLGCGSQNGYVSDLINAPPKTLII